MTPGESTEIEITLDHIAYRLPAGHRLRIAVSTSYWPLIWPAPENATVTLTHGALELPVRDHASGAEWTFPPPEADPPWKVETLRESDHVRRSETDHVTSEVRLIIEDDFGKLRDLDHGLVNGSVAREVWSIHPDDPLSARGRCHWTDELERDDIALRTETYCEMWASATHFHLSARLEAYENDTLVYERDQKDRIERDHM